MKMNLLIPALLLTTSGLFAQEKGVTPIAGNKGAESGATYAVVVGISDYQDPQIPDLRFADRDAEAFANFLRSPAGGSLDGDHLKLLTNEQATLGKFAAALDWLWEVSKAGDLVILYFSGHGDVEKKSITQPGYLLCWDAPSHIYLGGGALALPMFQDVVTTLSAQNKAKVVVITDACRSGKLAGSMVGGAGITGANLARQYANEIKILSCQPDEYSIEGEQWGGGRGAFSYNLVDALYGMADNNNDLWVTLQEVGRYLEDHVSAEVAPVSQVPMIIGNRNERLATVNVELLSALRSGKTNQMTISPIESRGMEDEVLAGVDSSVRDLYRLFKKALEDKVLIVANAGDPATACAEAYYERLLAEPKMARLYSAMTRNYAAALQDDAQQVLNEWLKTSQAVSIDGDANGYLPQKVFTEKVRAFPRCLDRAAELLGSKHYMYATLKARKYFFEGYLLANSNHNPDAALGERALALFRESLKWLPDQPQVYWQMSDVFGYNLRQPDSLEHYARRAQELYPNWIQPCAHAAFWLFYKYKQPERARLFLEQASRIDSNAVDVLNVWALFNVGQKNFNEADLQLKKALVLDSMNAATWSNLGYLFDQTHHYAESEPVYKKSIALDSTNTVAWNNLGNLYVGTHRYAEAEPVLKKSISLDSTYAVAWNNLGNLYVDTHRYAEAEPVLKKSISLDSTYVIPWINLGKLYGQTHRYAESEQIYKKSIALDSTIAITWHNLGSLYFRTHRYAESEQAYKNSISLDSALANAWSGLGSLYFYTSRYAESESVFKKSFALDSTDAEVWSNLGNLYVQTRRYTEAEPLFKKAIALDSTDAETWSGLGSLYFYTSRYAESESVFKKAIALDSTDAETWSGLGSLYFYTSRYAESESVFKKAIALDSTDAELWSNLGNVYAQTRRYAEAEPICRKAIDLEAGNAQNWAALGFVFQATRRDAEAERIYRKAIELDSLVAIYWNNLGFSLIQMKRYTEAEPALQRAIALDPTYANPRKHLGLVYFKTRRPKEARQSFLQAIALNPDYAPALLGMAYLLAAEAKTEEALGYLEQAIEKGSTFEQLSADEDLAPLREQKERWDALMKKYFPDQVKD